MFIFILYSCKKKLTHVDKLYDKIYNKIKNSKVYIIYGDDTIEEEKFKLCNDKYIILNTKDDYDNLNEKTLLLFQTLLHLYPTIHGIFKCDDDVIVNLNHINNVIDNIIDNIENDVLLSKKGAEHTAIDYMGNIITKNKETLVNFPKKHSIPDDDIMYCGGPLYYLSNKSLHYFNEPVEKIYYEDMMVGHHLNKQNIFPVSLRMNNKSDLYSDDIRGSSVISYHNNKHYNELYSIVQGGLGNQLFQIMCAMNLAVKYDKTFVLNSRGIIPNPHQKNNIKTTIDTIKKLFPNILTCDNSIWHDTYHTFVEEKNDCFLYTKDKLDECFNTYNNVVLKGYFINYQYICNNSICNNTICNNISPDDKRLLDVNFENTYFIHIRLGDFLKHPMYKINLRSYYNYCINIILRQNPTAQFYICTNQYDNNLTNYTNYFPKSITTATETNKKINYTIQDKSNNDIDTLYIMSRCQGAICSNSTLSFMGALFQPNKSKSHIFMPYPFVNFINGFDETKLKLDMYPEWCSVYNTLNDTIIGYTK